MPLTDSRSGSREQERPEDRLARLLQPLQPTQNLVERRRELIELMESGAWYLRYFSRREMNQAHEHLDLCNRMLQIGEAQDIMARPRVWVNLEEPASPVPPMRSPYANLQWEEPQETRMFGVDRSTSTDEADSWDPSRIQGMYNMRSNISLQAAEELGLSNSMVGTTISASTLSPSTSLNHGDSASTLETSSSTLPGQDTSTHPQPPRTSPRPDGILTGLSLASNTSGRGRLRTSRRSGLSSSDSINAVFRSVYQTDAVETRVRSWAAASPGVWWNLYAPVTTATFYVDEPAYTIPARDLWAETSKVWYNISLEHAKKVGVTIES